MSVESGDQIQQQILDIFSAELNLDVELTTDLVDEGLLDSLTFVDLLVNLEKRFGVTVELDELDFDNFRTVVQISEIVQRKMST